MNKETEIRKNVTGLRFTQEFKEMIKEIQTLDLVKGLQDCDLDVLQETQQEIRHYVRTLYKKNNKKNTLIMPDMYAIMVCLCVTDLDNYHQWEDFEDKFYPMMSIVGIDSENRDDFLYKCCCSHKVCGENVTVIRCGNRYLAVGDVCIQKYSIVYKFDEFKKKKNAIFKERKITSRKPHPLKKFLNREIEDYKPAAVLSYETYTYTLKKYRNEQDAERKKYEAENRTCACGRPSKKYAQCYSCKVKTQDICACGTWKDKKYGTCYPCRFKRQ